MENFRKLGDEEWRLPYRRTLTITPGLIPLLSDIIYLLQDFNSAYTRLVLISERRYKAACANPSYRKRFQAIEPRKRLVITEVEHGSSIKVSLEGLGPCIDALRRLIEELIKGPWWRWKYEKDKAKLELIDKIVSIIEEVYKLDSERPEVAKLAKAILPELQRIVQNPNRIEFVATTKDMRKALEEERRALEGE